MTCDNIARFTFRLPVLLLDKIRSKARTEGVSVNAIILKILWQYFEAAESGATRQ